MNTVQLLAMLPARVRQGVYIGYAVLGLLGTAALAFCAAVPGWAVPWWLVGGMAGLGALGVAPNLIAAANTQRPIDPSQLD